MEEKGGQQPVSFELEPDADQNAYALDILTSILFRVSVLSSAPGSRERCIGFSQ